MNSDEKINPQVHHDVANFLYKKYELELADLNTRHDRLEANMKKVLDHLHLQA